MFPTSTPEDWIQLQSQAHKKILTCQECVIHAQPSVAAPWTARLRNMKNRSITAYAVNEDSWHHVSRDGQLGWIEGANFLENSTSVKRVRRHYQSFEGNNIFALGGRIMLGPDTGNLKVTNLLLISSSVVWFAFVLPKMEGNIRVWCLSTSFLFFLTFLFLLLTATTEPGILLRTELHEELVVPPEVSASVAVIRSSSGKGAPFYGENIDFKYCDTCRIYRPRRAKHCSRCSNCCDEFDHHCPWTSNCIGARNYVYFVAFLYSVTLCCFTLFCGSFVSFSDNFTKLKSERAASSTQAVLVDTAGDNGPTVFLGALTFFTFWSLFLLTIYHSYLVCVHETTNENIRGVYSHEGSVNAGDLGPRKNAMNHMKKLFSKKRASRLGSPRRIIEDSPDTEQEHHIL